MDNKIVGYSHLCSHVSLSSLMKGSLRAGLDVYRVFSWSRFDSRPQVYDRCRGIDDDPVEPNPEPSRVSSSMSLVPLIKPAQCLGMPNEVSGEEGEIRSVLHRSPVGRGLGGTQQLAPPRRERLSHTQGFLLLAAKPLEPACRTRPDVRASVQFQIARLRWCGWRGCVPCLLCLPCLRYLLLRY